MKKIFYCTLATLLCAAASCLAQSGGEEIEAPPAAYRNPVVAADLPDPTVIRAPDGLFYLYATARNISVMRSADLVEWTRVGTAFTDATRPTFEPEGGLWAPDINLIDGRWVLYYSMSVWGGEWTCGIGVATADGPEGPFTDHGPLFRSNEIGVQNSIDQFYIEDGGRKWLLWGSFRGIYAIELADDGLSVKPGAEKRQVAGTAFEGTYVHRRGGWYYMFASVGSCCEGVRSTYRLVVGRSRTLFGPYVDREGRDMMENGFTEVIGPSADFVGNGHCSEIVTDEAGEDWILYHAVDMKNPRGRVLMLDRVRWDDRGWPRVEGGRPSSASPTAPHRSPPETCATLPVAADG
jgi:arabinan endo-1,5-alpha-L-arabinosidase